MSRPSTCRCKHKDRNRWVVLLRDKVSVLKCLACGWKWRSKRKYVTRLRDWRERSRKGITDQHILDRINDGTLVVHLGGQWAVSFYRNRRTDLRIVSRQSRGGAWYRFVEICCAGKKKKISMHRLVWIALKGRLVPAGFDIDHITHKTKYPDAYENLRAIPSNENRSTNKGQDRNTRAFI